VLEARAANAKKKGMQCVPITNSAREVITIESIKKTLESTDLEKHNRTPAVGTAAVNTPAPPPAAAVLPSPPRVQEDAEEDSNAFDTASWGLHRPLLPCYHCFGFCGFRLQVLG
jgi:hypothetical protein